MTPTNVSTVVQPPSPVSTVQSNLYSQDEKGSASLNGGEVLSRDSKANPVDKVSISDELRQTIADIKKEEAQKEDAKVVKESGKLDTAAAKVEFVYDLKGDLSIRYLDNASRLIYQVPSELMLSLMESLANSDSSVNTKA